MLDYTGRQLDDYKIIREIGSGSPESYYRFLRFSFLFLDISEVVNGNY